MIVVDPFVAAVVVVEEVVVVVVVVVVVIMKETFIFCLCNLAVFWQCNFVESHNEAEPQGMLSGSFLMRELNYEDIGTLPFDDVTHAVGSELNGETTPTGSFGRFRPGNYSFELQSLSAMGNQPFVPVFYYTSDNSILYRTSQ